LCFSCLSTNLYEDIYNIDEKWFELKREGQKHILAADEPPRNRKVKNKFKIMFLCAVARPRVVDRHGTEWGGKLGIWQVGDFVAAQRTSTRRVADTLEWKRQ